MELTVADLAKIAGANQRSVQHWAASGILSPNPLTNRAGTGTKRLFSKDEAVIACVMQALLQHQTPVGEMLRVAVLMRGHLLVGIGGARRTLGKIIRGELQAWLVVGQDEAFLVQSGSESFNFGKMKSSIATVIDLTAALEGFGTAGLFW